MTKAEKVALDNAKTIAYWSAWGGVEVKKIEPGVEDYAVCVAGTFSGKRTYHRLKIFYETAVPYVVFNGHRLRFDECLRA